MISIHTINIRIFFVLFFIYVCYFFNIFHFLFLFLLFFHFRLSIDHSPSGPSTRLHIKNLQVSDDDNYLCESTYLEPLESCDTTGAYNIKLNIYG